MKEGVAKRSHPCQYRLDLSFGRRFRISPNESTLISLRVEVHSKVHSPRPRHDNQTRYVPQNQRSHPLYAQKEINLNFTMVTKPAIQSPNYGNTLGACT